MAVNQSLTLTEVAGSANTSANTSKVRILWTSTQTGESRNEYPKTAKCYISVNGGNETEHTVEYTLPKSSTKTILDTTITVNHKDDGSGKIKVRTWMDTGISAGVISQTKELTLATIARASTITSASNVNLGSSCNVKWTPQSASFRYKLKFSIGSWNYTTNAIHPNTTAAYTYSGYTIPLYVAKQVTNAKTGTMTVTLYTYSDSGATAQIGTENSKTFTVTVPENDNTRPTVDMELSPVSNFSSPFDALYIQGKSKVKATTFTAAAKLAATIAESNITVNGKSYASTSESDILSQTGTVSVKATVKDSRGYYGTSNENIEVLPYSKPYVRAKSNETEIIAARCDKNGDLKDDGTYLMIKAGVVYSKLLSNSGQNNYATIDFRWRREGKSYSSWQTILDCKAQNSDEVVTEPLLDGALDVDTNYQVQIVATDGLDASRSNPITIAVPSESVYMHRPAGGKSMGLGGYSSGDGNLDVYWKVKARDGLSLFDQAGAEIPLYSTLPIPRDQLKEDWNPDNIDCGVYAVTEGYPLKSGNTIVMSNGVLIQMKATVDDRVKIQLIWPAFSANKEPMYRIKWFDAGWTAWQSMKL